MYKGAINTYTYFTLYFIYFTAKKQITSMQILNYNTKNEYAVGNPQNRNELP